ncbi:MAG: RNA polymerase sigma factor [Chloroflexota bacterium]
MIDARPSARERATPVDLVVKARSGDRDAFDTLAAGAVDRLYAVARLVLGDADRAADATQETLVRCWRDLPTLRDPARFDGWLHRLLMHSITNEFRSDRRHQGHVRTLTLEPSTADFSNAVVVRDQLSRGFDRLSPDHRAILVLRLYLGSSIEETAAVLGIPLGTAKSRLHYATQAMRTALESEERPTIEEART